MTLSRVSDPDPDWSLASNAGSGCGKNEYGSETPTLSYLLKNDVNLPVFLIRIWIRMFLGLPDPHPDPLVRGTDPRIQIRTKMSRISNTGYQKCKCYFFMSFFKFLVGELLGINADLILRHTYRRKRVSFLIYFLILSFL
jgi:hypothetical protein